MTIRLTVAGHDLTITPADGPAARDFLALLPLTLTLTDFHGIEKVADLPSRLSTGGEPDGTTGNAGDLRYYAPWGNLAIFYRDFGHAAGLVRLGAFDDASAVTVLRGLDGPTEVTISAVD